LEFVTELLSTIIAVILCAAYVFIVSHIEQKRYAKSIEDAGWLEECLGMISALHQHGSGLATFRTGLSYKGIRKIFQTQKDRGVISSSRFERAMKYLKEYIPQHPERASERPYYRDELIPNDAGIDPSVCPECPRCGGSMIRLPATHFICSDCYCF